MDGRISGLSMAALTPVAPLTGIFEETSLRRMLVKRIGLRMWISSMIQRIWGFQ